jgi:hypothetical protein
MNEKLSEAYACKKMVKRKNCLVNGRQSLKEDLARERQQKHLIRFLMKQTIVKLFNSSQRGKKGFFNLDLNTMKMKISFLCLLNIFRNKSFPEKGEKSKSHQMDIS